MTRDFNILIYWQQGVSLSRGSLRSQQWVGKARSGIRPHLWHWFSLGSCFSEPHALDHNKKMISTSLIKKINVSSTAESGPQRSLMSYLSISRKETLCYHVKSFLILKKYQKSKNFWKKSFHSPSKCKNISISMTVNPKCMSLNHLYFPIIFIK